jgi:hypothetical protein
MTEMFTLYFPERALAHLAAMVAPASKQRRSGADSIACAVRRRVKFARHPMPAHRRMPDAARLLRAIGCIKQHRGDIKKRQQHLSRPTSVIDQRQQSTMKRHCRASFGV